MSAVIKQREMSDQLLPSHVAKWVVSHCILIVWCSLPQTPVHSGVKKNIITLCNEEGKLFTSRRNKCDIQGPAGWKEMKT